jgi:hypothetical protein
MSTLVAPIDELPANIPHLKPDATNWVLFSLRFREAMQVARRWEYFDGTKPRPTSKDPSAPTDVEIEAQELWDHEDVVARYLLSQRLPDLTFMRMSQYQTAQARWTHINDEYTTKSVYAQNKLEEAFFDMRRPEDTDVQTYLMSVRNEREGLAAAGVQITDKDYQRAVLRGIPEELTTFASQLLSSAMLTHRVIDTDVLIDHICEEAERLKSIVRSQQGNEGGNRREEVTDEAIAATASGGGRRRRRGKCHNCRKRGHGAHECPENARAAQTSSGTTTQPETNPTGVANSSPIVVFEEDGSWMVNEEHAQIVGTEQNLMLGLPGGPNADAHALLAGGEGEWVIG